MVLAYVGVQVSYAKLLTLLGVTSYGTPGRNLGRLDQFGVSVTYAEGSMVGLRELADQGTPSVVLVRTSELPYWSIGTNHAVVVVGHGPERVFVNDPAFPDHPFAVPTDHFELAWMAFDFRYAVIRGA